MLVLRIIGGGFLILHGLVHLLYFGQSQRYFELQPGLVWPDSSWAFSPTLGDGLTRALASASCVIAAIAFVAGGTGILIGRGWWRAPVVFAAAFFTVVLVLLWNGQLSRLDDQGAIAILINAAILVATLVLRWPDFGF
jgi:hypothetical protein